MGDCRNGLRWISFDCAREDLWTVNRLWYNHAYRQDVKAEIARLAPWYQNIYLGAGIWTRPWNRETLGQWVHCERGVRKLNRFILPVLPVPLLGASILEVGTNAGGNLIWAIRRGAERTCGVELDKRYYLQAQFVRGLIPERRKYYVSMNNIETMQVSAPYGIPYTYAWLLNVIYHIPDGGRVNVVRKVASVARYIIFQGNGLEDRGRGDGYNSLMGIVKSSGLIVDIVKQEKHVRGLVIVAEGRA